MSRSTELAELVWWRRAWRWWTRVAQRMGAVQTETLLGFVYFTVVGLTAVIGYLIRWDPLGFRFQEGSHWVERQEPEPDLDRAARPF